MGDLEERRQPNSGHRPLRRQRSFSPTGRKGGGNAGGLLNMDFQMPAANDEDDADLQAAIAMSMAAAGMETN